MRGASNRKIIFLLCGILVILILFGQTFSAKAAVKSTPKTTLIIGDSIAYGMALGKKYGTGVDGADRVYWLAEGGVNISLLHPDFKIHLGRVMPKRIVNTLTSARDFDLLREVKKKKIEDIVISAVHTVAYQAVNTVQDLIDADRWGRDFAYQQIQGVNQ